MALEADAQASMREVEMRFRATFAAMLAVMTVIGGLGSVPMRAAQTTTDKPTVQVPEDKALVYFVRPKRPGSRLTTFLYIDDEFVGVLEDNSFTYAFVEEGRHVLWTFLTLDVKARLIKAMSKIMVGEPWEGSGFNAVRGRTYYFWFDDPKKMQDEHVRLDEKEGAEWIDKVKFYSTPTSKEAQTSAQHLTNRSTEAVERFELAYAEIPEYSTPEVPVDRTGFIRIDANTEISLELVQNVVGTITSGDGRMIHLDSIGDDVWFRVTGDSASAGGVWLREGTLVRGILYHEKDRRSSVVGDVLDVVVPAVVAVDGTVVPTQGEIYQQGGRQPKADRVVRNLLWTQQVLWGHRGPGPYPGKRADLLLGSMATIYTRDPVWIAPVRTTIESDELKSRSPALRLRVPKSAPFRFPPSGWGRPDDLKFLLELPKRPAPAQARFQGLGGAPTTCSRRLILPTSTKSGSTRISGVAMILIPESGRAVVNSQGHPGNAGSIEGT